MNILITIHLVQAMENNFQDILREGESVSQFTERVSTGKGKTQRARDYIRPIAFRYVERHEKFKFEVQAARRQPAAPAADTTTAPAPTADATTVPAPTADATTAPAPAETFVDANWVCELEDIEVQELDGTWRGVTIFRNKQDPNHVCMWFGNDEYEGIDKDHPYEYCPRTEILLDDEGYDINWRMQGLENGDDSDCDDDDDDDDDRDDSCLLVY